jgi:hypothetical protein
MKLRIVILGILFCVDSLSLKAQGYINLGFESVTLVDSSTARIDGWSTFGFPYGDPTVAALNNFALDAPLASVHGTNSPIVYPIQGRYTVLLQGGTPSGGLVYNTNGASVYQNNQIPVTARSLTYLGNGYLQVSFSGQRLTPVRLGPDTNSTWSGLTYNLWGIDVSAFAGQSGELRFTAPWQSLSLLDRVQFTSGSIPEPKAISIYLAAGLIWITVGSAQRR